MTEPTLSVRARAIQDELTALNNELLVLKDDAIHVGLAPFRIAHIRAALTDNEHAWEELNRIATALELTGADHKP